MLHKLAVKRMPLIKDLKIEKYFSGPESFTPDSNFLLGETEEIKNFYVCCGFNSIGIGSSGGAGLQGCTYKLSLNLSAILIVPTLCVGMQPVTLRVTGRRASLEAFPRGAWERSIEAIFTGYGCAVFR